MAVHLDITYTTLVSELLDRTLDAQFDNDFNEAGSFVKQTAKGRDFWYYQKSVGQSAKRERIYVGPADDPEITKRVENFARIKDDYQKRRKIVSTLTRQARLFRPEERVGNLVEAFWKAGLFRLRACLVGTIAFQTYGTVLGCRIAGAAMQTGDIDLAQFHSISVAVEDSIPPILEILRNVDEKFAPVVQLDDQLGATRFKGSDGLRVEFLTPNTGSDDNVGKPVKMPSLGGAAAEPLRFLDFLIHEPVRTVMLHKGGIPVLVPDPARFAVHKMIVADRRERGTQKDLKDLGQADKLAEAFKLVGRSGEITEMFHEAVERGPAWRIALENSRDRMRKLGLTHMSMILEET
ncbi:MAG: GSU2403 family nucleotidyltransferase fold protein [Rhizobiaceae bacterium]